MPTGPPAGRIDVCMHLVILEPELVVVHVNVTVLITRGSRREDAVVHVVGQPQVDHQPVARRLVVVGAAAA